MIIRTIHCGVCGRRETEPEDGMGWPGWGRLEGISLDGAPNPHLCPACLAFVMNRVDERKHNHDRAKEAG